MFIGGFRTQTLPRIEPEVLAFARTAPHIRGRVFKWRGTWHMQVINTHTGKVLASDNTNHRQTIADEAHRATAAARGAWTFALRRKDLL